MSRPWKTENITKYPTCNWPIRIEHSREHEKTPFSFFCLNTTYQSWKKTHFNTHLYLKWNWIVEVNIKSRTAFQDTFSTSIEILNLLYIWTAANISPHITLEMLACFKILVLFFHYTCYSFAHAYKAESISSYCSNQLDKLWNSDGDSKTFKHKQQEICISGVYRDSTARMCICLWSCSHMFNPLLLISAYL